MDKIDIIIEVCNCLNSNKKEEAKQIIETKYKHEYIKCDKRAMSNVEKLKIYIRDGFIDRYNGKRLLFPNVLRIITTELGNEVFPFHTNWKMSNCHIAYWNYMPTYDHVIPIARGGMDKEENIVTTSQIMNSAKSNFLIDELGWELYNPGKIDEWDGMMQWYIQYRDKNISILEDKYIKSWNNALEECRSLKLL